jgi:hypothetical protein
METTIRTKQYGGEIILPNLTSEAGAKTYGPPCIIFSFRRLLPGIRPLPPMINKFYIYKFCAFSSDGAGACTYRSDDTSIYGKPIRINKIESNEFSRQLMSFIPQIKRLDMMLDFEIE